MLLLTQLSLLFTLTCALPATITNQSKFTTLRKIILADIINSPQNLREYARASFHDLANYDPVSKTAGPHGCIGSKTAGQTQNKDLVSAVSRLKGLVDKNLPNSQISFGDLVSFAGKVAIETAYCVSIPWRSGRPDCTADQPEQGPSGSITTLKEFQPFLDRYGFSAKEMGVLLSGAHGLKDSVIRNEKGDVIMAFKTSGTQWISETVEEAVWIFYNGTREFEPLFLGSNAVGRLPVDMVFFPTILKEKSSPAFGHKKFEIDDSKEAYEIEEYLERFIPYEAKFNREFARVFSKMLAIGTDGKGELYQDETLNC